MTAPAFGWISGRRRDAVLCTFTSVSLASRQSMPPALLALVNDGTCFASTHGAGAHDAAWLASLTHGYHGHQLGAAGILHDLWDPACSGRTISTPGQRAAAVGFTLATDADELRVADRSGPAMLHLHIDGDGLPPGEAFKHAEGAIERALAAIAGRGAQPLLLLAARADRPAERQDVCDAPFDLVLAVPGTRLSARAAALASGVDLLPTMLDWLGLHGAVAALPGHSLLPCLDTPALPLRDAAFASQDFLSTAEYEPRRVIRTRRHRLVVDPRDAFGEVELYDLAADPGCRHDLSGDERMADVQRRLSADLHAWRVMTGDLWLTGGANARPLGEA